MKRIEVLKKLLEGASGVNILMGDTVYTAENMIKAYQYLDEEIDGAKNLAREQTLEGQPKKRVRVDKGKLLALFRAGWMHKQIAEELGCAISTVSTVLRKAGEEGLL